MSISTDLSNNIKKNGYPIYEKVPLYIHLAYNFQNWKLLSNRYIYVILLMQKLGSTYVTEPKKVIVICQINRFSACPSTNNYYLQYFFRKLQEQFLIPVCIKIGVF